MKRRNFFMSLVALVTGVKAAKPVAALTPAVSEPTFWCGARFARQELPPLTTTEEWKRQVQSLITERRKDPRAIHSVPFPVSYQELR
jgi:hypothetical protein